MFVHTNVMHFSIDRFYESIDYECRQCAVSKLNKYPLKTPANYGAFCVTVL